MPAAAAAAFCFRRSLTRACFSEMFKFIKAKGPHPSAERQKLQKELFSYRRVSPGEVEGGGWFGVWGMFLGSVGVFRF